MNHANDVVGHKTLRDDAGHLRHEPLTRREADALLRAVEQAEKDRAKRMPTDESAVQALFDAWLRLKELGWREPRYAPSDSSPQLVVEIGSSGIHRAVTAANDRRDDGTRRWWSADGEMWPMSPLLFKPMTPASYEVQLDDARKRLHEAIDARAAAESLAAEAQKELERDARYHRIREWRQDLCARRYWAARNYAVI